MTPINPEKKKKQVVVQLPSAEERFNAFRNLKRKNPDLASVYREECRRIGTKL